MDERGSISDYRSKMDRTLASPGLTNHEKLQTLVRNQILQYSSNLQFEGDIENVVEKRSKEVSNFLGMLRSTSLVKDVERSKSNEDPHADWKVKQDTEEYRVMYREGPEGTPYHTLLVEGYVDGPLDVCLCISWESGLYNRWWPETAIPTFKVISSRCLQRVGDGEQISLVRMKVSWPLSSREAVIHYFVFEYFQDDLMVVLLNSISDSETIESSSHGFTKDGIPEAEEVVRIDVVGGFALQKVTADRSYFRTIANMDIKLDFVPPSFINFVSRQLVGSGFKLYKKEVASVAKGDQNFGEALKDPLYARIREALDSESSTRPSQIVEDQKKSIYEGQCGDDDGVEDDSEAKDATFRERNEVEMFEELKENNIEGSERFESFTLKSSFSSSDEYTCKEDFGSCSDEEYRLSIDETIESSRSEMRRKKIVPMSPNVEKAVVTIEKAIAMLKKKSENGIINELNSSNLENEDKVSESSNLEMQKNLSSVEARIISLEINHASRRETKEVESGWKSTVDNKSKNKRHRFCCLHFIYQY